MEKNGLKQQNQGHCNVILKDHSAPSSEFMFPGPTFYSENYWKTRNPWENMEDRQMSFEFSKLEDLFSSVIPSMIFWWIFKRPDCKPLENDQLDNLKVSAWTRFSKN